MNQLYVTRDDTTGGRGMWWCVYAEPGSSIFVGAEGYCSRVMTRTRREAIARAQRMWNETPVYWPASSVTAPEIKA